jgi:hypothetical protein
MTPTEYEEVTKDIVNSIFRQVEGIPPEKVRSGVTNKWTGISQAKHQIDVSVEGRDDVIIVECKNWNKRVGQPAFLAFLARILDIKPTEKRQIHSVVVTTIGFDRGNIQKLAEYYKIDLQVVHSAEEFVMKYKMVLAAALQDNLNQWADDVKIELN